MKYLVALLATIVAFNTTLLLVMLYWFVFADGVPPFVQGRPEDYVAFGLATTGFFAGVAAWVISMECDL